MCDEDESDEMKALIHDTSILPHLMTDNDIEVHFPAVKVPPAVNGEVDIRPEVELADPGPRGKLDLIQNMLMDEPSW